MYFFDFIKWHRISNIISTSEKMWKKQSFPHSLAVDKNPEAKVLEAAAEANVVVPRLAARWYAIENVGWPHVGLKDNDLDGGFRSSNLIVWCPGFMDVLSGSTFCGLRVRPLGDNQDHSALKYEVLKYQMPTFQWSNDGNYCCNRMNTKLAVRASEATWMLWVLHLSYLISNIFHHFIHFE